MIELIPFLHVPKDIGNSPRECMSQPQVLDDSSNAGARRRFDEKGLVRFESCD